MERLKVALEAGILAESGEERRAAPQSAIELGIEKVRLEQAGASVSRNWRSALPL